MASAMWAGQGKNNNISSIAPRHGAGYHIVGHSFLFYFFSNQFGRDTKTALGDSLNLPMETGKSPKAVVISSICFAHSGEALVM